jgi:hypothetical protein
VNGRIVVDGGHAIGIDETKMLADARQAFDQIAAYTPPAAS